MKNLITFFMFLVVSIGIFSCTSNRTESETELRELEQDRIELAKEEAELRKEHEELKRKYQREKAIFQREHKAVKAHKVTKQTKSHPAVTIELKQLNHT